MVIFLLVAMAQAFVPAKIYQRSVSQGNALAFGFLKDLGLEKPSWLPDFGGKKSEEPVAEESEKEDEESSTDEE